MTEKEKGELYSVLQQLKALREFISISEGHFRILDRAIWKLGLMCPRPKNDNPGTASVPLPITSATNLQKRKK